MHAVAFVDEGANLSRFAEIRKSKEQNPMADPNAAASGGTIPAAARDTLVEELSKAVEAMLATLDYLKAAPVSDDPAAVVPAEVTEKLEQIGMMIAALGSQFEPPEVAPPADAGAGVAAAAPAAPGPVAMAMTEDEAKTMKAFGRGIAMKAFRAIKARMRSPEVAKGKLKLTFDQHSKIIRSATDGLMSILMEIAPMLADTGDVTAALAPPPANDAPPPAEDAAAAAKKKADEDAAAKKLFDAEAEKSAAVAKQKSMETDIAKLRADFERLGKSRGPSNAAPLETPPPAPNADEEVRLHGRDFSAEYAEKQKKTGAAQ